MNTYDVYEWCPYCEAENEYLNVPEGTMISNCKTCGRPIVLCDKCYSMYGSEGRNCGSCKWEKKLKKMMKKWEKEQIGKIVHWKDSDDDLNSDYCKIVGFNKEGAYVLRHIFHGDGVIESYGRELDFLDEEKQIEIYMKVFRSQDYRLGLIKM